jgi:Xaa-Pro dipeptidase
VCSSDLCALVKPGIDYLELHVAAHREVADLLAKLGVLKVGGMDAVSRGLTRPFLPHGVGHFLGIQVHDVGGRQAEPIGGIKPPPAEFPYLRTTRRVEERQVFTIEPGVYFIPMLLRDYRTGPRASEIDWKLVDRLTPCGGVRIEDDVCVTKSGHDNLTRPWI